MRRERPCTAHYGWHALYGLCDKVRNHKWKEWINSRQFSQFRMMWVAYDRIPTTVILTKRPEGRQFQADSMGPMYLSWLRLHFSTQSLPSVCWGHHVKQIQGSYDYIHIHKTMLKLEEKKLKEICYWFLQHGRSGVVSYLLLPILFWTFCIFL